MASPAKMGVQPLGEDSAFDSLPSSGFANMQTQSPCMVKNTFIQIGDESQQDMYGDAPTTNRRRMSSAPPSSRRQSEAEGSLRTDQCRQTYQQEETCATGSSPLSDKGAVLTGTPASSDCDDMNQMHFPCTMKQPSPAVSVPSTISATSTRQVSTGIGSDRQYSDMWGVGDYGDEQEQLQGLDEYGYQELWMQGGMMGTQMMHGDPNMLADMEGHGIPPEVAHMPDAVAAMGMQGATAAPTQNGAQWRSGPAGREPRRRTRVDPMLWDDGVVTVMVRQIPRRYTQLMFLKEVNRSFEGFFDFLYLPYDLKKGINVGYGFINFISHERALEFRKEFDNSYIDTQTKARGKPLRVHPASVQGYEANFQHFAHTKTGQKQDPQFSPLFFPKENMPEVTAAAMAAGCGAWSDGAQPFFGNGVQVQDLLELEARSVNSAAIGAPVDECPNCGATHRQEHNFCPACGYRLRPGPPNLAPAMRTNPVKGPGGRWKQRPMDDATTAASESSW
jgi:hypothetical protein